MELKTEYRISDCINDYTIRQMEIKATRIPQHNGEIRIGNKHFLLGSVKAS